MPGNDSDKREVLVCLNVDNVTDYVTSDGKLFQVLPPQNKTLSRRLFEDVSVVRKDPLMTQNANVVDLEARRLAVYRVAQKK